MLMCVNFLPFFALAEGDSANPPPSGTYGAKFIAATDMVGGSFSDDAGIVESGSLGKRLNRGIEVHLYPIPDNGYTFKEWQIVDRTGTYSLEVEDMSGYGNTYDRFIVPGFDQNSYIFEIRAVFEYNDAGYPIDVSYVDTTNSGCSLLVDKTDVKVEDTVTITVNREPGAVLDTYVSAAGTKPYPRVRYEQNDNYSGTYKDIDVTQVDVNTYTFKLPDRIEDYIEPTNKKIYVYAQFVQGSYSVTVNMPSDPDETGNTITVDKAGAEMGDTVTVSVEKWYATDLDENGISVYWMDGDVAHDVDCEYTAGSMDIYGKITDTYTFQMPDHDVLIAGGFVKTGHRITTSTELEPSVSGQSPRRRFFVNSCNISNLAYAEHAVAGDTVTAELTVYNGESIGDYAVTGAWITWEADGVMHRQDLTNVRYDQQLRFSGDFVMPAAPVTLHMTARPSYMVHVETYPNFYIDYDKQIAFAEQTITVSAHPFDDTDPDDFTGWTWRVVYYENGQPVDVSFTIDATETNRIRFAMPEHDVNVSLTSPVAYVDRWWNGQKVVESIENPLSYNFVRNTTPNLTEGLWIADQNCTFSDGMTISGNVELVLCDGITLTVEEDGLLVPEGSSLTIYGQANDTGILRTTGSRGDAGIGGDMTHPSGEITIKGGKIYANGGTDAAGIGGGQEENSGYGPISIYGGYVEAIAGSCAAGIGGGQENPDNKAGNITIYGGEVHATGGKSDKLDMDGGGAGIGGGEFQKSGAIYIYGGKVRANVEKSSEGAGIGGGGGNMDKPGTAGPIYIYGGDVEALASEHGAAIGGGSLGGITSIVIDSGRVIAGTITTPSNHTLYSGAGIGGGESASQGGTITINGGYVEAHSQFGAGIGGGGLYGKDGGTVVINGGEVYATSCYGAGIGGGGERYSSRKQGNGGHVTIKGGCVFAASETIGAGIGGGGSSDGTGRGGDGGTLIVDGGFVVASSGSFSYDWVNYMSTVYTANPYQDFAIVLGKLFGQLVFSNPTDVSSGAIGGGFKGEGGTVIVYSGTVIANAGAGGKAIGGGSMSDSDGSIQMPEQYAVKAGTNESDARYVTCDTRSTACKDNLYVEISRCRHENATYTNITEAEHTFTCPNCLAPQYTEQHTYASGSNTCTVCGYHGTTYAVSFAANGGSGTMDSVTLVTGGVYTLPTCGFTAPESKVFKEWSVVIGNAAAVTKAPSDKITVTADTTVTAVWKDAYEAPTFIGYAMRLDGKITLQYFVGFPAQMTPSSYSECYVTFEGKNVDSNKHYALSTEKSSKADGYVVELDISSIEMAELFTPTLHYTLEQGGDEITVTGNAYSAQEYIDHGISHFSGNDLTIVKALADYGHYSQPYLSAQNNWRIGTDYAEMTTKWSNSFEHDVIKNATSSYVAVRTTSDDITAVTYKVRFGSEISIAVFLTPADGVTIDKIMVDGAEVKPSKSGSRYYVIIPNISVTKLTESHTISYGTASITVSPMSYVNGILSSGTTSDAAKDLVCALYNLAEACK